MKYLYIANWKMNLSFDQSVSFCNNNHDALQQLSKHSADIVICPSFIALAPIATIFKNSAITLGAQNCSEHQQGPYTGEVSAESLAQAGITYCIVGHSERRIYYNETTKKIILKIKLLYTNNIIPIMCIGESLENFSHKKSFTTLKQQLEPILTTLAPLQSKKSSLIIAYEPLFSIGTGIIPETEHLTTVFTWLTELVNSHLPNYHTQLLYGGSVNENNIATLKKIVPINGFLIGTASTHFERLKKIIISNC